MSTWNDGITSIYKKQRLYHYFYLTNPPSDEKTKEYLHYIQTQNAIQKEINSALNIFTDKNTNLDFFIKSLEKKQKDSLKKETELFSKFNNGKVKYTSLTYINRIKFWTNYFLFPNSTEKEKWDKTDCFSYLIRSEEFFEKVKSTETNLFSRSKLLQQEHLSNKISLKMLDELEQNFKEYCENITQEEMSIEIKEILVDTISIFFSKKRTILKNRKNKEFLATTFSTDLKNTIKNTLKVYNLKNNKIELKNSQGQVFLRVVLDENQISNAFTANQDRKALKEALKSNDEVSKKQAIEEIKKTIIEVFQITTSKMSKDSNIKELNLKGVGVITFEAEEKKDFFKKALLYIKSGFRGFLRNLGNEAIKNTFLGINSNAWVSGMIGELASAIDFNKRKLKGEKISMTGSAYGEIDGSSFGGSVNDLIIRNKAMTYGVNIKNYVTKDTEITLYDSKNKRMSIYSPYMQKYFKTDEISLIRWALLNQSFLQEKASKKKTFSKELLKTLAWNNISSFLRVEDKTDNSLSNLFFQINNIIYPTSYIYNILIKQIKTTNFFKDFFQIKMEKTTSLTYKYKNREEAIKKNKTVELYKENFLIDNILKKFDKPNMYIQTKGLKVNLVNLGLLK